MPDPAGLLDGVNLYKYVRDNPTMLKDSKGTDPDGSNKNVTEDWDLKLLCETDPNCSNDKKYGLFFYTDPESYSIWVGYEGKWVAYIPAKEVVIRSTFLTLKTPLTLKETLAMGKEAVEYAHSKLRTGIGNKTLNLILTLGGSDRCVKAMRSDYKKTSNNVYVPFDIDYPEAYKRTVFLEMYGCGNCGEMAHAAYWYLYDKGYRPIDRMSRTTADHAFVVLGRIEGSNINDPSTWGKNAVVVDPWRGEVFPASEIPTEYLEGDYSATFKPKLLNRKKSGEL